MKKLNDTKKPFKHLTGPGKWWMGAGSIYGPVGSICVYIYIYTVCIYIYRDMYMYMYMYVYMRMNISSLSLSLSLSLGEGLPLWPLSEATASSSSKLQTAPLPISWQVANPPSFVISALCPDRQTSNTQSESIL